MVKIRVAEQLRYIDKNIRKVVHEMNINGVDTLFSCAGHRKKDGTYERGYISVISNHDIARKILAENNISIEEENSTQKITFRFKGQGGMRNDLHEMMTFDPNKGLYPDLVAHAFNQNLSRIGIPKNSNLRRRIFYALYKSFAGEIIRKNKDVDKAAANMSVYDSTRE